MRPVIQGVRQILTGPRKGRYYVSASGAKVYRVPMVALHPGPHGAAARVRFEKQPRTPGQREAMAGVALINRLHAAPGMPPIRLEMVKGLREKQGLASGFDQKNGRILFDADHSNTRYSAVQMFAHALDHHLLTKKVGTTERYGTDHDFKKDPLAWAMDEDHSHPALREWKQAVIGTERFARLVTISSLSPTTRPFADHLATPHTLFAHSYAKWVAERSGDETLKKQIADRAHVRGKNGVQYPMDWDKEDFAPVAAAFDKMFGDFGWRKPK